MLRKFSKCAAVAATLCVASIVAAHASTNTWYLSGVTFQDGAKATGWFNWDDVNGMEDFNLATTGVPGYSGFTYEQTGSYSWAPLYLIAGNIGWASVTSPSRFLTFTLSSPLTGATGDIAISLGSYQQNGSWEYNPASGVRLVDYLADGGNPVVSLVAPVSAVPEVETLAMLLAGMGLIGTVARRRSGFCRNKGV